MVCAFASFLFIFVQQPATAITFFPVPSFLRFSVLFVFSFLRIVRGSAVNSYSFVSNYCYFADAGCHRYYPNSLPPHLPLVFPLRFEVV